MVDLRTPAVGAPGGQPPAAFTTESVPTVSRQPAAALGPRAHRTIGRIIDATREVFLTRGYSGTTIDEIARIADVSRASFYTYFPSKREVLLEVGEQAASMSITVFEGLHDLGGTRSALAEWVERYFAFLDVHGSFSLAWAQAALEDEEIRTAGMKRHLRVCRTFGTLLAGTAGRTAEGPELLGLVATSTLERSWHYSQLYADAVRRVDVVEQVTQALWALARQPGVKVTGES